MPIYELQCLNKRCNTLREEILHFSDMTGRDSANMDLSDIEIKCAKCGKTVFKKLMTAHGKSSHNWSSWQRKD